MQTGYCETLVSRGKMDSCTPPDPGKPIELKTQPMQEKIVQGKTGVDVLCPANGVLSSSCGGGSTASCKGF